MSVFSIWTYVYEILCVCMCHWDSSSFFTSVRWSLSRNSFFLLIWLAVSIIEIHHPSPWLHCWVRDTIRPHQVWWWSELRSLWLHSKHFAPQSIPLPYVLYLIRLPAVLSHCLCWSYGQLLSETKWWRSLYWEERRNKEENRGDSNGWRDILAASFPPCCWLWLLSIIKLWASWGQNSFPSFTLTYWTLSKFYLLNE